MDNRFAIIARLTSSPLWAIRPEAALFAVSALLRGAAPSALDIIAAKWEAAKPSMLGTGDNKLAIIPIQGVLSNDGPSWYGSNYQTISAAAEAAMSDASVKRVILAVDSPGGEVMGCPETGAVLARLAKTKPTSTMVEGQCASAALWLGSQANDITITPSGEIGSVGVRMMHADVSKMLEDMGVKITELYSGEHKTEWSPYSPLSEDAKADMQPRLEAVHQDFINAVAAGRGSRPSADIVAKRFGEGRMFNANDAIIHGLADNISSARDFYRAMAPALESNPSLGFRSAAELLAEQKAALVEVARHRV